MFLIARGTAGVLLHPVKMHKHKDIIETITGDRNVIPGLFCFIVTTSSLFVFTPKDHEGIYNAVKR